MLNPIENKENTHTAESKAVLNHVKKVNSMRVDESYKLNQNNQLNKSKTMYSSDSFTHAAEDKIVYYNQAGQNQTHIDDFDQFEYPQADHFNKNTQKIAIHFFRKLQYMLEKQRNGESNTAKGILSLAEDFEEMSFMSHSLQSKI